MNKTVLIAVGAIVALVVGGAAVWAFTKPESEEPAASTEPQESASVPAEPTQPTPTTPDSEPADASAAVATGRYTDYSSDQVAAEGYNRTILFFHAPWCPDCRAYESAIQAGTVPDGVQILKVDYDSNQELRKQYGVTVQTSFVAVDSSGNKQTTWVGYGKNGSLETILENTA